MHQHSKHSLNRIHCQEPRVVGHLNGEHGVRSLRDEEYRQFTDTSIYTTGFEQRSEFIGRIQLIRLVIVVP
jgi:hypothetical protein